MTQPGRPNDPEATKALANLLAALAPNATTPSQAVASPDFARAIEALSRSSAQAGPVASGSGTGRRERERTTSSTTQQQAWHAQPTRSGRVPRLPDPSSISADPLSLLDLPSESESDDPDFRPHGLSPRQAKRASKRAEALDAGGESGESPAWGGIGTDTDADWVGAGGGADDIFGLGNFMRTSAGGLSNADLLNSLDFSAALGHAATGSGPTFGDSPEWTGISSTPAATADQIQSASNPDGRPSPLTAASLAGIPFVNVSLPDSDDSPEFLPPPPKRQKRERDRESYREGSVAGSEISLRSRHAAALSGQPIRAQDTKPLAFQSAQDAAISRNNPAPSASDLIANYKSQTVIASVVAPPPHLAGPSYSHHPTPSVSASVAGDGPPLLTKKGQIRLKTGPKPKLGKEEKAERKRQMMRDTRARNKEYVEDLEARVAELEEENARLREENDQLLRESRENWRSRALGLPDGITQPTNIPSASTSHATTDFGLLAGDKAPRSDLFGGAQEGSEATMSTGTAPYGSRAHPW